MSGAGNTLLDASLATLADLLPSGFSVAGSGLRKRRGRGRTWIVLRGKPGQSVTCLVLARGRVEARDLESVARAAAGSPHPTLLVSSLVSPAARARLPELGIGYFDLAGNARIELDALGLHLESAGGRASTEGRRHGLRSLSGPMAGRVVRALIDLRPPHTLGTLSEKARVDPSYVSRVLALAGDAGWLERRHQGRVLAVDWPALLRAWAADAPLRTRGELCPCRCPRATTDFFARLARSGFLHALTGLAAYAALTSLPAPRPVVLYVDDAEAAMAQFGLRSATESPDLVLVKGAEPGVYQRSRERAGLRHVSPSLMAADLDGHEAFESALAWMAAHESAWRL